MPDQAQALRHLLSSRETPAAESRVAQFGSSPELPGGQFVAVLIGAGHCRRRKLQRFARAGDILLLVTTPDPAAVCGTYQTLKKLADGGITDKAMLVVNQAEDAAMAAAIHQRLSKVCRRFIGVDLRLAGFSIRDRPRSRVKPWFSPVFAVSPSRAFLRKIIHKIVREFPKGSFFSRLLPIKGEHCR